MADWSLAKPPVNVFANFQQGRDDETTRQNAFADRGMAIEDRSRQMQQQQLQNERAASQDQRAQVTAGQQDHEYAREDLLREAMSLRQAHPNQRAAAYQATVAPKLLKYGVPQQVVDQALADGALSDEEIDQFIVQMGGEPRKLQALQMQNGGLGTFDPYQHDPLKAVTIVQKPVKAPPAGYDWGQDGQLHYIPGGPNDPHVAGSLAGAKRAPKTGGKAGTGGGRDLGSGDEPNWGGH